MPTPDELIEMSDEDFLKNLPGTGTTAPVEEEPKPVEEPVVVPPVVVEEEKPVVEVPTEPVVTEGEPAKVEPPKSEEPVKPELDAEGNPVVKADAPVVETPINYEESYKEIMKPFKANGKMIELRSPEEAIKLMQQGANYTRKVQELMPVKKLVSMLEKHNLLDESKLSFLIDLENKNPDAIKKLVKDSGIDPLDINTDDTSAYQPSNHSVPDAEVNFTTALQELNSTPEGNETLQEINKNWDQVSKDALFNEPAIMQTINAHRESGLYARVKDEVERHKMLGNIDTNVSFLAAYYHVAKAITEPMNGSTTKETQTPQPVAVRAATPKSPVADDEKVRAASSSRASPSKVETKINPLAMADDEFMKLMDKRL